MHKQPMNNDRLRTQIRSARGCTPAVDDAAVSPDSAEGMEQDGELSAPHIDGVFLEHKDNN